MITLSSADTSDHLMAGRRAAYAEVLAAGRAMTTAEHTGQSEEEYAGGYIRINGLDIGPAIDAAVLETLVRIEPQLQNARDWERILLPRHPREKFLRSFRETIVHGMGWGAFWLAVVALNEWWQS